MDTKSTTTPPKVQPKKKLKSKPLPKDTIRKKKKKKEVKKTRTAPSQTLPNYIIDIKDVEEGSLRIKHESKHIYKSVEVHYHDTKENKTKKVRYTHEKKDTKSKDTKSKDTKAKDTKENKTKKDTKSKDTKKNKHESTLIHKTHAKSHAEAHAKAKAKFHKTIQRSITGSFNIEGLALFSGSIIKLRGTLEDDGEYHVKSVKHIFNSDGWMSNVEFSK